MISSRRVFLRSAAGLAIVSGTGAIFAQPSIANSGDPASPSKDSVSKAQRAFAEIVPGGTSPNGWLINTAANSGGSVWTRPVPGTGFEIDVAIGDVEVILVHIVRRFHYEIDTLRPGEVIGFKSPATVKRRELNHASGTAIDIRPGHYPPDVRNGFYPHELAVIRDILTQCEGAVKWGGDFSSPDEAHFEIGVPPTDKRVRKVAQKIRGWNITPGAGAGVLRDLKMPG
ncbi:M15 family metallopeptidase [Sphaerisporangium sp. NPDC051011]|uniref:M15 family metallopeptidase n=1 Tax=Sphaerisporangium sp. NPDC051011 TaxID=3155792 RepID=UPI0033D090A0